jgi:hypothetical protein
MATSNPEFPRRLAEGDDQTAALIARALAEPVPGPSEQQSWHKLRSRGARFAPRWAIPAAAGAFAAIATLFWFGRPAPAPTMAPDVWTHAPATAPQVPRVDLSGEAKLAQPPTVPSEHPKPLTSAQRESAAAQCGQQAKAGQYEAAAACYGRAARGSSMDAELALYEKARLEAKALGKSALALSTLDEHARRFPGGVLTTEVELTRIELLSQLGRRAEALSAIERGLSGALGRERRGDLLVLRAVLLGAQGDCGAALVAARLARAAGAHPARLEATERRCQAPGTETP